MNLPALVSQLVVEAQRSNQRRMIVLVGDQQAGYRAAKTVINTSNVSMAETTLIGSADRLACERYSPDQTHQLLGQTRQAVIVDAHIGVTPNTIGQLAGIVAGGGLYVVLIPPFTEWITQQDAVTARLAVPPYQPAAVGTQFRRRLVETWRRHQGIAIVDLAAQTIRTDGLTDPAPATGRTQLAPPPDHRFPAVVYEACLTADQRRAVTALETLADQQTTVLIESDRGRGKSSAAGLAASQLAADGETVTVTARTPSHTQTLFDRAAELAGARGATVDRSMDPPRIVFADGGVIRFQLPDDIETDTGPVIVEEAAAIPVDRLRTLSAIDRVAFLTTIHGYEGAGRGFSVRFKQSLSIEGRQSVSLTEPIRYAAGDPIERWAFDALLLDAHPVADEAVRDVDHDTVTYQRLTGADLVGNDAFLRELFGLLVVAHYRTEPNDLARLLDAPNLAIRALCWQEHVIAVAVLAREGGLSAAQRQELYEGGRIRGHMIPDLLTSQLRDEHAGTPTGARIVRIATHPALRSQGVGSRLLALLREETQQGIPEWSAHTDQLDWLGVGFGATPRLVSFWRSNGYQTLYLSATRNERSGLHSAIMLAPLTESGQALATRVSRRFLRQLPAACPRTFATVDPAVLRNVLAGIDPATLSPLSLSDWEWDVVGGVAYGPGLFDVAPRPFVQLVCRYLIETPPGAGPLAPETERLLIQRVLQGHTWETVRQALGHRSVSHTKRALGTAIEPLADRYGGEPIERLNDRFDND